MSTLFFQFLKNPLTTGAICPSSPALAKKLISDISLNRSDVVVELGPGTGAVTRYIRPAVKPGALFFAVELNKSVIPAFKKKFPEEKIYQDTASNLPNLLKKENVPYADSVISALPWATFPDALQDEILSAVCSSMHPGSTFSTFTYIQGVFLPAAIRFRRKLDTCFSRVERTSIVWWNFPPAFCYHCWK